MTTPVYSPGELVSDADRESAIETLRAHMLTGRLTAEEFEGRVGAAHSARTRGDLDAIRIDLPPSAVANQPAPDGDLSN
jgi:hypothetical protein